MSKATKVEVKQDSEAPIGAEVIAKAIVEIDTSMKAMLNAGLKYETIVTLVHDHSGVAKRDYPAGDKQSRRHASDVVLKMSHNPAVPYPVIPPSDVEKQAVALMAQITTEGVEVRAKKLKDATLSGPLTEPTVVPTFVERKNAAETEKLQAEIDALQRGEA